jgi:hypothetical protein
LQKSLRPLHWVIKVSDLKGAITVLEALGACILRHEEFDSACDAKCNGGYTGHWSKTMMGWSDEHTSFVLELTYNYDVSDYSKGNQLNGILMHATDKQGQEVFEKLMELDIAMTEEPNGWHSLLDGELKFRFLETQATSDQLIVGLDLNVNQT